MSLARLPLFPLGLVLYPEVVLPLHLFEPRYRRLLADVQAGDRRFGIICAIPGVAERALPAGRAGCVAEITDVEMLPDGRADIVVVGRERFLLDRFVDDPAPYHVIAADPLRDRPGESRVAMALAADEVLSRFTRIVQAVRILNDDRSAPPTLPDDPALVAWHVAAMIDLDLPERQALLEETSATARLARVDAVLRKALPDLELRAAIHQQGRG